MMKELGYRPLLITLTVDPKRFDGPRAALELVQAGRKLSRGMGAFLQRYGCGEDLGKGRWMSRLEFQRNGMPHWHVLTFVPKAAVRRMPLKDAMTPFWSMGFSNVQRRFDLKYLTKACAYVTKGAEPSGVRASGLPWSGYAFITVSKGGGRSDAFWEGVGEPAEGVDDVEGEAVPRVPRGGLLADRIAECDTTCAVVVESDGAMGDRSVPVEVPAWVLQGAVVDLAERSAGVRLEYVTRVYEYNIPGGLQRLERTHLAAIHFDDPRTFIQVLERIAAWDAPRSLPAAVRAALPGIRGVLGWSRSLEGPSPSSPRTMALF
jgi:hypothetical protein